MGGTRSGRWRGHRKARTVEKCLCLDFQKLARETKFIPKGKGKVEWTYEGGESSTVGFAIERTRTGLAFVVFYVWNGKDEVRLPIDLESMPMRLGGVRWWARCPLANCGQDCMRRVGKLFLPPGGQYFGCRQCHGLTYQSAQEHDSRVDRILRDPNAFAAVRAAGFSNYGRMSKFTALGLLLKASRKVDAKLRRKGI